MSTICQNFVQNAWKKELCSNCFKSKDEHVDKPKPKPIQLISNDCIEGIIRNVGKIKPKQSVGFKNELIEFIGYGGEDWNDDDDDDCVEEIEETDREISDEDVTEVDEEIEKELKRITKQNTDFNTMNLKHDIVEITKTTTSTTTTTPLLLGKPLIDSNGKKQTLVVSITPFGQDVDQTRRFPKVSTIKTNKEFLSDTKSNVILRSYIKNNENLDNKEEKSLLDEISETLENSKNPIQIITKKKMIFNDLKELDNDEKKQNNLNERKTNLTRTPALKKDKEKPIIYQTSTAKIELKVTKNIRKEDNLKKITPKETIDEEITIHDNNNNNKNNDNNKSDDEVKKDNDLICPHSREQAGEPDGRADEDSLTEPPALPLTPPPPLEIQTSFLHSNNNNNNNNNSNSINNEQVYDKPKLPIKPVKEFPSVRKIDVKDEQTTKMLLKQQDSNSSDMSLKTVVNNKRRAPKPPPLSIDEIDRDIEIIERAGSCSPNLQDLGRKSSKSEQIIPKKILSISTDNLEIGCGEEKRKDKTKTRFSLKRFLRIGSSKDLHKDTILFNINNSDNGSLINNNNNNNINGLPPLPKPKLVIVHPSELNGAQVQVVPKANDVDNYQNCNFKSDLLQSPPPPPPPPTPSLNPPINADYEPLNVVKQKPPPPPRNIDNNSLNRQQKFKKQETIYANIGEVRSALVPNKPQRTASMREREAQQQQQGEQPQQQSKLKNENYEDKENVYDYINSGRSSSPDSDSSPNKNSPTSKSVRLNKRSESSIDVTGEYFKYSIPRSVSLTYCGSETESEIYSPYSFYGSESEVAEDDDWNSNNGRIHKLRSRKGRSIVHKNLEDNYGAVIAANHEALAQVLENIQQNNHLLQPALRGLKTLTNLRWSDFSIKSTSQPIRIGCRTFHQALWGTQHVTLAVHASAVPTSPISLGTFSLISVTEFSDLIPKKYLGANDDNPIQAAISVFPWFQVNTIESYSELLRKNSQTIDETSKETCFIMLQLINALKTLQGQGIEELSLSLNRFILCREVDKGTHQKLYVLQGIGAETVKACLGLNDNEINNNPIMPQNVISGVKRRARLCLEQNGEHFQHLLLGEETPLKSSQDKYGTLCTCAYKALMLFPTIPQITPLLQTLLNNEKSITLTQVKSILEFYLWGPSDVLLGNTINDRELALQRWLDLQRATVLHGLVCARIQLTVYEENHLYFLVRSNARMMCDASLLLESSNFKPITRK